jgi:hypothetical protein
MGARRSVRRRGHERYVQQLGSIGRTGSADAAMILFNSLVEVLALA